MAGGEDLLAVARIDTYNNSQSLAHKIKTSAWYAARKKVLHAPRVMGPKLLGTAASKIPVIGDVAEKVVNAGAEKIVQKVLDKQKADKTKTYREAIDKGISDQEALRKNAKWEAKTVKGVIEKLEQNQVKLRDASNQMTQKVTKFIANPTDETVVAEALKAVCEEERYIEKLALLSAWAQAALEQIDAYISDARVTNLQAQKFMVDGINQHAEKGMVSNPLYQPPGASSAKPGMPMPSVKPPGGFRF